MADEIIIIDENSAEKISGCQRAVGGRACYCYPVGIGPTISRITDICQENRITGTCEYGGTGHGVPCDFDDILNAAGFPRETWSC